MFCTHEYTLDNLRFAMTVEPGNEQLKQYQIAVQQKRQNGEPSLPSTIEQELAINPFIRLDDPALVQSVKNTSKKNLTSDCEIFEQLRLWKNRF